MLIPYLSRDPERILVTYIPDYVKGEISVRNEIITHNLEVFEIASGSMDSGNQLFLE